MEKEGRSIHYSDGGERMRFRRPMGGRTSRSLSLRNFCRHWGAAHMKAAAKLAVTAVCLSWPAPSHADAGDAKQFSNDCLRTAPCHYEPSGEIEKKYYARGP